jgi:hypothetical protein
MTLHTISTSSHQVWKFIFKIHATKSLFYTSSYVKEKIKIYSNVTLMLKILRIYRIQRHLYSNQIFNNVELFSKLWKVHYKSKSNGDMVIVTRLIEMKMCSSNIHCFCAFTLAWNGSLRLSRPLLITTTIRYDVSLMWSLNIWILGTWQPSLLVMNRHQKDVYYDEFQQFVENI